MSDELTQELAKEPTVENNVEPTVEPIVEPVVETIAKEDPKDEQDLVEDKQQDEPTNKVHSFIDELESTVSKMDKVFLMFHFTAIKDELKALIAKARQEL